MRFTGHLMQAALGSTRAYLRTILNPTAHRTSISESLKQLQKAKKLEFQPKALLLFSTPQYSNEAIKASLALKDQQDDLQIFYGSVDSVAPFLHRNAISELWLNKRITLKDAHTIEEVEKAKREPRDESDEFVKPGRVVSVSGESKNWELNSNNWFLINIPFVPKHLSLHHSIPSLVTNIKFKLGSTIFHNPDASLTCFYFLSKKEKKTLNRMDMNIFKYVKKYLDNDGHYLHDAEIELPPILIPGRNISVKNYHRLIPLDKFFPLGATNEVLKVTELTGNLVKKINGKPASSIIQDNDSLMSVMTKDTKIYATIQEGEYDDVRRYEVIAGGGAWGAKASTLALDPASVKYLKQGSIIKFYILHPQSEESLNAINTEKLKAFFGDLAISSNNNKATGESTLTPTTGGIFAESSVKETVFGTSKNQADFIINNKDEVILENVFGFGSESQLQIDDKNFDSEGEVVAFQKLQLKGK